MNEFPIEQLLTYDVIVVAGQGKEHCVWTIDDLLEGDDERERALAPCTYLLEDAPRPSSCPEWTTRRKRTPLSTVSRRPGCTSSARRS